MQSDESLMSGVAIWAANQTRRFEHFLPWQERAQIAWERMLSRAVDPGATFKQKKNYLCTRAIGGIIDYVRSLSPYGKHYQDHDEVNLILYDDAHIAGTFSADPTIVSDEERFEAWIMTLPECDRDLAASLSDGKLRSEAARELGLTSYQLAASLERIRRALRLRRAHGRSNP